MNPELNNIIGETCSVVSFTSGFLSSCLVFWLFMIHSRQTK